MLAPMAAPSALTPIVHDLAAAARDGEHDAFFAAGQRLADEVSQATQQDIDAAVALLAPVVAEARQSLAGSLAQYLGSMIGMDGDAGPALGVLAERATQALDGTRLFVELHEELVGPVPERSECGAEEFERFVAAAGSRIQDPQGVARYWMYAESWVQPVLFLAQRADVRRALPHRDRLTKAATAAQDALPGMAPWLVGLLRVRDDEPLIVLHRPTGAGFRVTTSGVADNFQLHTLLAAHLIPMLPAPRRGLLRRPDATALPDPPTPAMVAAADGSGDHSPAGGITGQFNLVDATGSWIWNEGRPDEIPLVDGVRVVVLDPLPYERGWNAGRAYPLLRATVHVVPLTTDEARFRLSRVGPAKSGVQATQPSQAVQWTHDMTVHLPAGRSVADVVDLTCALSDQGVTGPELAAAVAVEFSLSDDDAALAVERVFGGRTRAATADDANRPDPTHDPIAFESYRRARERPEL